jgi:imidazole glycerol-phosphate synthase subunit HisH
MITIIDYGVGNLASVRNMLKKCGIDSRFASDPTEILSADKLILPGVGAFDAAMQKILDSNLSEPIVEAAKKGTMILGICLGAQLLMERSEEGALSGLSLIAGECKKFDPLSISPLRVPHMGWSDIVFRKPSHPLSHFEHQAPRFYFAHSYYLKCKNENDILAKASYGIEFTCGVVRENIMGVQFHPEKSHFFGASLLNNFAKM